MSAIDLLLAGYRGGCPLSDRCRAVRPAKAREILIAHNGNKAWFVYILCCGNGALYTGVTTDVRRRLREHQANGSLSARFTRAFPPVELAYRCCVGDKRSAYQVEYRIKRLKRREKAIVIAKNFSKAQLLEYLDIQN